MATGLLIARVALAVVFLVAAVAKLFDLDGARAAVVGFGVPERAGRLLGLALPVSEFATGAVLLVVGPSSYGALAAATLLVMFLGAIATAMAHGEAPDCHCFGQLHSAPAGGRTLARNGILLAVAVFVGVAGWGRSSASPVSHVTGLPGLRLAAIAAALALLGVVGFQIWFSLQLLAQNGRTIARLEALETLLRDGQAPNLDLPGLEAIGSEGTGLPIGSPAPEFELLDVRGGRQSLRSLSPPGLPMLLIFSDAGCGPCNALMPDLAAWQRRYAGKLGIAIIAAGSAESNRAKAEEHGLESVLLQDEREVSNAYQAFGTPTAVVVKDGLIRSRVVAGSEGIERLLAAALQSDRVGDGSATSTNGRLHLAQPPPPDTSRIGEPAPELTLTTLDGSEIALADLYRLPTLAIFWNPGCGFCQRMLPDLKALENHAPRESPRLVVISAGDPDRIREDGIRSTVLHDPDGEAMRAFAAPGTPMAVLVENGRIASPVAAGAEEVLALARGTREPVSSY